MDTALNVTVTLGWALGLWETSLHAPGVQDPFVFPSPCPWPLPF